MSKQLFDAADRAIAAAYPDSQSKGPGWWGAKRVPNFGILRGAIVREILAAIEGERQRAKENQENG